MLCPDPRIRGAPEASASLNQLLRMPEGLPQVWVSEIARMHFKVGRELHTYLAQASRAGIQAELRTLSGQVGPAADLDFRINLQLPIKVPRILNHCDH